jgi:hypothetical protein
VSYGFSDRDYHVYRKWYDGDGHFRGYRDGAGYRDGYGGFGYYYELDCHQRHKPGHAFWRHHGRLLPDYSNPKFGVYGEHYRPFLMRHTRHTKGFYRCIDREGLNVECYKQTGPRG